MPAASHLYDTQVSDSIEVTPEARLLTVFKYVFYGMKLNV